MTRSVRATLAVIFYFLLVLSPLIVLLLAPRPPAREFWREFAVALGFAGLALMGLQFVPTARLPFMGDLFPMDIMYYFHHQVSLLALGLILAHPVILVLNNRYVLQFFNLGTALWRARAGVVAAVAVVLLVVLSVWRKELKAIYEAWRVSHAALAVVAVGLAMWHIFGVRHYLALPAQRVLWIAWAVVWVGMVAYVRLIKPLMLRQRPYRITAIHEERDNTWTMVVEPVGHEGMRFQAGQFAWLTVDRSPFSLQQHPFSFVSSAEHRGSLCFAIKELGDFTAQVKNLPIGTTVYVDGPYGTFAADCYKAPGYAMIAGGIGSGPIMSMLRTMVDRGEACPVVLFYGCRTWDAVIFREELEELQKRPSLRVVYVLQEPPEGWEGERGFITADVLDRHLPDNRRELGYFISGPIPMISLVEKGLRSLGVPRGRIHSERYEMA